MLAFERLCLHRIKARFEDALDGTRRIRDIARGLTTFGRVERDRLAPVDLVGVIENTTSLALNEIRYRARLVTYEDEIEGIVDLPWPTPFSVAEEVLDTGIASVAHAARAA